MGRSVEEQRSGEQPTLTTDRLAPRAFALVFALSTVTACRGAPQTPAPIAPATLPDAPVAFEDGGHRFVAPSRGDVRWEGVRAQVHYDGGEARLQLSAIHLAEGELERSDAEMADRLRNAVPDGSGAKGTFLAESDGDVRIYCLETAVAYESILAPDKHGDGHTTFCVRVDDAARAARIAAVAIFGGLETRYRSLGGARVAAEAARSATGFVPERR